MTKSHLEPKKGKIHGGRSPEFTTFWLFNFLMNVFWGGEYLSELISQ